MRFPLPSALAAAVVIMTVAFSGSVRAAGQVRHTEIVDYTVRSSLRLPGTVESRTMSLVASEVEGLVIEVEVREGDRVRRDQPLVRLRTVTFDLLLREAEGRLKEAQARLQLAEHNLERARNLHEDEIVSQGDLDDAFSEFTAWRGRVDQTEAEIERLKVALYRCVIRAPFAGVVSRKLTEVGEWLTIGGQVVELVSLDDLEVRVEVPERSYDRLQAGVPATVTFASLPDLEVTGRIDGVIPRADPQARTFPVRVRISNPGSRIGVGMLAEVALAVGEPRQALVVPKDAVVRQGAGEVVYRIRDDETVEAVTVQSGVGMGSWVVVTGQVAAGERVVTRGNERLFPGQTVDSAPQEYPLP